MNGTEFDCQECGDIHRLSIAGITQFGRIAIAGEAHYVATETLPGGKKITVVKLHCPYKVGVNAYHHGVGRRKKTNAAA